MRSNRANAYLLPTSKQQHRPTSGGAVTPQHKNLQEIRFIDDEPTAVPINGDGDQQYSMRTVVDAALRQVKYNNDSPENTKM